MTLNGVTVALLALACLQASPASAWDSSHATHYPSDSFYRPEADTFIAHNKVTTPAIETGRITGPLTALTEMDPPVNLPVFSAVPQVEFQGRQYTVRTAVSPRSYAYVGQGFTLYDGGSGHNGPLHAGYAGQFSTYKNGYPSPTASGVGELDSLIVAGRQSGPQPTTDDGASDFNGIQGNIQQGGYPGFIAFIESLTSRIDPTSFALKDGIRIQVGVLDAFGKNGEVGKDRYAGVNPLSFGYGAFPDYGRQDRAFFATNNGGSWDDFLWFGNPGVPSLRVKGVDGSIVFGNDSNLVRVVNDNGALKFYDQTNKLILTLSQGGAMDATLVRTPQIIADTYATGSSVGVSCSGPPSPNFTVVNGIVTQC